MTELRLAQKQNRAPADELADVREKIKNLKQREDVLREAMISGDCALIGDEFEVSVVKSKSERIDAALIKKELGLVFLRPFLTATETVTVKLKRRK